MKKVAYIRQPFFLLQLTNGNEFIKKGLESNTN